MAETILADIAANVLSSLGSYAIQQIGLPSDVKEELRKMETNISTIKDVLLDAEERQMSNRAVKGWLERLKLILYDTEDLLDEVATETKRGQVESLMRKVYYFFTSSNSLVFRYVVGRKIRDIGKRLDEIVLQMNAFKFVVKLVERPIQINRREETSSFVNTVTVIGRDADKEKLVRLLLSPGDEENVAIIPIVGMGGLGKTTLAQLVYNDDRIQKHFTKRLWVCISNDFDVRRILIKLLQAGDPNGGTSYGYEGLEQLQYQVRNLLCGHKFVLFLDDVWNEDRVEWKKLRDLLISQARYLDLTESYVPELPEDFCKLISLRFLGLTTNSMRLPKEGIGRLTSLRTLYFFECNNLESLGEGIEHLTCLRDLVLVSCSDLVSLSAGFRHLTSLERLEIDLCESLNLSDDDDLKGLISLKELKLTRLPQLVNLPMGLRDAAATLTRLEIGLCENFTSPSESVLPNLLSLQSLTIWGCDKVVSLPGGMQHLTKLQDLFISGCSLNTSIRYREGGVDWPKIAHMRNIKIY
ncbi:hypothetical protein RHGRI_006487 [Rhododendron griersonianum]|uniref:Disease resistance protein RGA3 n=1 Tax=Rhododendron griersonianum TaxID=479676 RepID=A0AAV6KUN2_9ERIC|nr:hypothetical protein RHGRI_006487 [Rhododendron griersonianum]